MNNIKTTFSIKDFENLSGIKAHTIRIWEKRYNLLEPIRTSTNIRTYNIQNLQKLLNVVLLTEYGYKISKISKLNVSEINDLVSKIQNDKTYKNHALSAFKVAMLNFDQNLFLKTYDHLLSEKDFNDIFFKTFIPLLEEIGVLWTTDTITPAHEHFVSYLIKHKILTEIEKHTNLDQKKSDETYVLFLPFEELHDLGLLFIHYNLVRNGYHSIFLGKTLPIDSLLDLKNHFSNIKFVSLFTVYPEADELKDYLNLFEEKLLKGTNNELHIFGRKYEDVHKYTNSKINAHYELENFVYSL